MGTTFTTRILNIFFPVRCHGCRAPGSALCTRCINRISFASPLPKGTYAVYDYGNPLVRRTIRELKYHRRSESARVLAHAASPHIAEYIATTLQGSTVDTLIIVPIPEHRARNHSRGFNQSELFATWLATALEGSSVQLLLEKTVATLPQARLNRARRLKNVTNTMRSTQVLDRGSIYVVVDDVTTTGATFAEATRALRNAGATKTLCIALAHGYART